MIKQFAEEQKEDGRQFEEGEIISSLLKTVWSVSLHTVSVFDKLAATSCWRFLPQRAQSQQRVKPSVTWKTNTMNTLSITREKWCVLTWSLFQYGWFCRYIPLVNSHFVQQVILSYYLFVIKLLMKVFSHPDQCISKCCMKETYSVLSFLIEGGSVLKDCGEVLMQCVGVLTDCGSVRMECGSVLTECGGDLTECRSVLIECGGVL